MNTAEIRNAIEDGEHCFQTIARMFDVDVETVELIHQEMIDHYEDVMGGDHDSALASVGWGTDEDYGYHDEY